MKSSRRLLVILSLVLLAGMWGTAQAEEVKIIIMQDQAGVAQKYRPLVNYLKKHDIDVTFVTAPSYPAAADMFMKGSGDAMFSGSGVAGSLLIKELAGPLVRPVTRDGVSTYSAVIVVKRGALKYTGEGGYFAGKKVALTPLASSGEIYLRSVGGHKSAAQVMKTVSHDAALDTVARNVADIAVVKNTIWEKNKAKYAQLEQVGHGGSENPDNTLMVSKKMSEQTAQKLKSALLAVKADASADAAAIKTELGIQGYIETSESDFQQTLAALRKAGVDKSFNFNF